MVDETKKTKTFDDWRKEYLAMRGERDVDKLNALATAIDEAKDGISDDEKERILAGIKLTLEDIENGEIMEKGVEDEPEPVILHDEIMPRKKVIATTKRVQGINYLGYMVTFSVGSCAVPIEKVDEFWEKHHIEGRMKPHVAHPKDAFARACATLVREESAQVNDTNISVKWNSTRLAEDVYMITRRIIIEGKGDKPRDLGWQNIIRIKLNSPSDENNHNFIITATAEGKGKDITAAAKNVEAEIRATYQMYMENIVDKQVRDALRNVIYASDGINFAMGRGGAWFVPLAHQARLEGWKEFAKMVNAEHLLGTFPVSVRVLPIADEADYQEWVREDVAREVKGRMEALLTDTLEALEKAQAKASQKGLTNEENADTLDKILQRNLEKHAQTINLLEDYKDLLRGQIRIDLTELSTKIERVEVPLSARHQTLLRKLVGLQKPTSVRSEKAARKIGEARAEKESAKAKTEG